MTFRDNGIYKLLLIAATLIWGASFVVIKNATDVLPVDYLLGIRFSVSAVLLALIFMKRMVKSFNWAHIWRGLVLGCFLFAAYWFQTEGVTDTTPGKNAFLTCGYVVLVPFLDWLISKRRPDAYNIAAAFVLVCGVGLVSLSGDLSIRYGDYMTLIGAIFYAIHIVFVARFTRGRDVIVLTVYQFVSMGILSWVFTFATNGVPPASVWTVDTFWGVFYLAVFASAVALLFQNIGQKHTPPTVASVLLSLESVFGVMFSIAFYGEQLTLRIACGFALIFMAVITSETKLSFLPWRKKALASVEEDGAAETAVEIMDDAIDEED